jgi:hypothetical protein
MGRTNTEVKEMATMIPKGSISQSIWKYEVCNRYKAGESLSAAMRAATDARRKADPDFEPDFDRELLALA